LTPYHVSGTGNVGAKKEVGALHPGPGGAPLFHHLPLAVDEIRHAIERMAPAEYLMTPYYVHWLHAAEDLLDKKGVVTHAELEQRMAELAKKEGK
jgi:nitrile hydratase beta subunit-like protein